MKRRVLFKLLTSALGLGAVSAIPMLLELDSNLSIDHDPIDMKFINKQINFIDEFIIVKKNNKINVFSAKCTHLGCKINNYLNDEIICPCHGSHFDLNGKTQKGPAIKSLKKINFRITNNLLIIIGNQNEQV